MKSINFQYFWQDRVRRLLVVPIAIRFLPSLVVLTILVFIPNLLTWLIPYRELFITLSLVEVLNGLIIGTIVIKRIIDKKDTRALIALELTIDVFILAIIIHNFPSMSWPIFIFFTPEILGGAYALSTAIPYYIASLTTLFLIYEALYGTPTELIILLVRVIFLFQTAYYSSLIAETLISEREKSIKNQDLVDELKEANLNVRSAEKMKNNLFNMASHELRTPLTTIKNSLWFLLKDDVTNKLAEKDINNLETISKSTDYLVYILVTINQMLETTSGKLALDFESVQIERVIQESIKVKYLESQEKQIELKYNEPIGLMPEIIADTTKLKYVLWELLTKLINNSKPHDNIDISTYPNKGQLIISIRGSNQAILDNTLQLLTEPSDQIDTWESSVSEFNFGILLAKKIIDLHSGSIDVNQDDSSIFINLSLPIHKNP